MTYREFINRPLSMNRRIAHKMVEVDRKREACMRTTSVPKELVMRPQGNSRELNLVRYFDADKELREMQLEFEAVQDEIRKFLYENLKPDLADLMEWRYVDCCSVAEIASMKSMTEQSVRNKISRGNKAGEKAWGRKSDYEML